MNRYEGGRAQSGFCIGVLDIGGTKILAGLIDPAGELVARRRIETLATRGAENVIARCAAFAAQAQQAVLRGNRTVLANLNANPALLTAEQVVRAAEAGDAVSTRIVERAGTYLGIGLAAVATAFDPEMIVVGGGVARPDGMLLRRAREVFQARALMPIGQRVRIVPALLGDESGLWGAAALISSGR